MKRKNINLLRFWESRVGYVLGLSLLYWIKSLWAYIFDYKGLDITLKLSNPQSIFQTVIAFINPIPLALFLIGLALYIKNTKTFYWVGFLIYATLFGWMLANTIYYREFSDFITLSTIIASRSAAAGMGTAAIGMLRWTDLFYTIDFLYLIYHLVKKTFKPDTKPVKKRNSLALTAFSVLLFSINLFVAELERPELLSRGFSNTQVIRSLSLPAFFFYNSQQAYNTHVTRMQATSDDLTTVKEYVQSHYAKPNPDYYGLAKGRNVIYIHLESFQQFLIDFDLEVDGKKYEVTPFLNSLYHSKSTFAFSNFFHQVKAGKTSDAETMFETSLFGLPQGSFMVQYGGNNTQQAAPHLLAQNGYQSSAVFHGNKGSFWNRNNTYKQWGYHYFFDQTYFTQLDDENSFEYGLNDKVMFADSIQYLERLQQPFYVKYLTVTNHYPFSGNIKGKEVGFPSAKTTDETINGYFETANYLDASVKDFFDYLKKSGLYDKSVIVLYGDHYGIANSRNTTLAPLLGQDPQTWTEYNNAMMQRVPYMIVVPGTDKGGIHDTYGGEIDGLPTLEHLLGIDSSNYYQVGQDLLSKDHDQIVAFRASDTYVTPEYTSYGEKLYYTKTGQEITNPDEQTKEAVAKIQAATEKQLSMSDAIQTGDLLRFADNGVPTLDVGDFNYLDALAQERQVESEKGKKSTSLYSKKGEQSTVDLYKAPTYQDLYPPTDVMNSSDDTKTASTD